MEKQLCYGKVSHALKTLIAERPHLMVELFESLDIKADDSDYGENLGIISKTSLVFKKE